LRERFQLFLFPDKFKDGTPVTMKSLNDKFSAEMEKRGRGSLMYKHPREKEWYYNDDRRENFFTTNSNLLSWKLLSRSTLKGSMGHDCFEETKFLREYLRQNNLAGEDELAECSDERLTELKQLNGQDWKEASRQLSELKINKNYRINPLEAIFMHAIKQSEIYGRAARTAWRSSYGGMLSVGEYGQGMAIGADYDNLDKEISNVGIVLSL